MRPVGSGLRTLVVTLDPKRNELQKDAPAAMLRTLGHAVEVVGYDLAEVRGAVDVVLVEAGEHLEIGRHAIRRLRQRPELVAARILLCIEVGRVSGLDPEMGADDFILMPVTTEELSARLRQLHARDKRPGSPLQVRYGDIVLDCEMRQAYLNGQTLGLTPLSIEVPYSDSAVEFHFRKAGYEKKAVYVVPNLPSPLFATLRKIDETPVPTKTDTPPTRRNPPGTPGGQFTKKKQPQPTEKQPMHNDDEDGTLEPSFGRP